jgi:hypothetical protein
MAQSVRLDTSYGYEEARAREMAMHGRLVQCGVDDASRHEAALAHIARAQETFAANLDKRRATAGLLPVQQPGSAPLSPPPSSFLRRAPPVADTSRAAAGIDRMQARFATFVELQNESRRRMLATEMLDYAKKLPQQMCI